MMAQIKNFASRKNKNGWHLQKIHDDLLHIVSDIENKLNDFAKRPGRRAHKIRSVKDCERQT